MKKYLDIDNAEYYLKSTNKKVQGVLDVGGDLSELTGTAQMIGGRKEPFRVLARENGIFVDMADQIKEIP